MSRPGSPAAASQQHPLVDRDGHRKYVFSKGGEEFFLRVITSGEEMAKYPESIKLLGPVMFESKKELAKKLVEKGEKLKTEPTLPPQKIIDEWQREWPKRTFGHEDNQTVFILENKAGEPAVGMILTLDDPKNVMI